MCLFLGQASLSDPLQSISGLLFGFVLYVVLGLLPALVALYLMYLLLTLPLRRNERARLFLDLLQFGIDSGRSAEIALVETAGTGDRTLGPRFLELASYLQQGLSLEQALGRVPRLLPPQVRAMLSVGQRIGDIRKVLPACRLSLHGGVSQVRGALNYLLVLCFMATPFSVVVPLVLKLKVLPSFRAIFSGMLEGALLPAFTRFVLTSNSYFIAVQVCIMALIWFLTLAYLGGPRLRAWLSRVLPGGASLIDRLLCTLPWRRRRLQRDFSSMLAALLETGVPEAEAVTLAGESTANFVFRRRAQRAAALLAEGIKLPEALRVLDQTGELQWRVANALRSHGGFLKALTGWHEALDAKAFQLEQTAAQTATTIVVLLNGLIVACILIGMFLPLIQLLNRLTLW